MEGDETPLWIPGVSLLRQRQYWQVVGGNVLPDCTDYLHIYMVSGIRTLPASGWVPSSS